MMLKAINSWFFDELDPSGLRWHRWALGLFTFWNVFTMGRLFETWYRMPIAAWYLTLGLTVLYLIGWQPRLIALLLLYMLHQSFYQSTYENLIGDYLPRTALVYDILIGFPKTPKECPTWAVRAAQLQILFTYTFVTLNKWMSVPEWRNGTELYYILNNPMWGAFPYPQLLNHDWFLRPLTWGSLFMEFPMPFLAFIPRLSRPVGLILIGFHVIMAFCMNIVESFTLSIIPMALFLVCQKPICKKSVVMTVIEPETLAQAA